MFETFSRLMLTISCCLYIIIKNVNNNGDTDIFIWVGVLFFLFSISIGAMYMLINQSKLWISSHYLASRQTLLTISQLNLDPRVE